MTAGMQGAGIDQFCSAADTCGAAGDTHTSGEPDGRSNPPTPAP